MPPRRRFLASLLGIAILASSATVHAAAEELSEGAHDFVASLAEKAIDTLAVKEIEKAERERRFRTFLRDNFDLETIGIWVLGRHWRNATSEERTEYLNLFEELIVKTYANRFKEYAGERLRIRDAIPGGDNDIIVHSEILRRDDTSPIRVDWRVRHADGSYKVVDVVVAGVSMSQTQRSEFGSVIRRSGGDIKGLLAALKSATDGSVTQTN
jgi:phospholipid transport system substrate-binding protein